MSSRKLKRLVLILVVLLVFALGGYLITDSIMKKKEQAAADEEASMHLFSFDPISISKVTMDTKAGSFVMDFADSTWKITETDYPYDITLNTAYISTICSYMSELTAVTKFDSSPDKLADYGLAEPTVLVCSTGSTEYTLHLGNATPTQEYFYAMVPGNDTVYGIAFDQGSILCGDIAKLKSPYMLNYNDADICALTLERENEVIFDLEKKNDLWAINAPLKDANISSATVNSLITALVRLEIDTFVGTKAEGISPEQYKLDKPYATLTVKSTEGKETIIDFAPHDAHDGVLYILYRNEQEVATMAQSSTNFINAELSELMNKEILLMDYYQTASVDAVVDDISFRMEMDEENGIRVFDGMDITALGAEGITTFRALFDTMSNLSFEELQLDADVDVTAEPAVSFRYTMQDGTERELALIPADDSTYWALVDGEYTGLTVRRRSLSGTSGVLTFHERMTDLIADSESSES